MAFAGKEREACPASCVALVRGWEGEEVGGEGMKKEGTARGAFSVLSDGQCAAAQKCTRGTLIAPHNRTPRRGGQNSALAHGEQSGPPVSRILERMQENKSPPPPLQLESGRNGEGVGG